MIKKIFLITIFMQFLTLSIAHPQRTCASNEVLISQINSDSLFGNSIIRIEEFTKDYKENFSPQFKISSKITIPIVIHILYNSPDNNISDEQIISQIKALNEDFNMINSDVSNTPDEFSSLVANINIEFKLAVTDPNGYQTKGITRTEIFKNSFDAKENDAKLKSRGGVDIWDNDKFSYLNIWVVPSLKEGNRTGILGYAQFPGLNRQTDGIVIDYKCFGTLGSLLPAYNKGRTLTHEVGHFFNLRHIWGDETCGNDRVDDTPTHFGPNFNCPPQNKKSKCPGIEHNEMTMNFMDYSNDNCMCMFTLKQKERMLATLAEGGPRYNLTKSSGLN